jgi:LDH2 family malate/lactate/ureidoglycolate dehydrogenase
MSEQNFRVPVKDLVDFMIVALHKMDIPLADARIIADVLITSDLCGGSITRHGTFKDVSRAY